MANLQAVSLNLHAPDFAEHIPTFHRSFRCVAIACPNNAAAKLAIARDKANFAPNAISKSLPISEAAAG
ncbi:MAG: hypothetical protein M3R29_03450 [Verrucomicrobiota bacterium]|nr:hypothetical protein [Verrucomicrobiota bacterium]